MKVESKILIGWSWFGVAKVRLHLGEKNYYTVYAVMLTNKLSLGIHVGGGKRK